MSGSSARALSRRGADDPGRRGARRAVADDRPCLRCPVREGPGHVRGVDGVRRRARVGASDRRSGLPHRAAAGRRLHGLRTRERRALRRRHGVPVRAEGHRPGRPGGVRRPDGPVRGLGGPGAAARARPAVPRHRGHRSGHGHCSLLRGESGARSAARPTRGGRRCARPRLGALGRAGHAGAVRRRAPSARRPHRARRGAGGVGPRAGRRAGAVAEVRRRAGGHLDPDLAARFVADADAVLAPLDTLDLLATVVAAEPGQRPPSVPTGSRRSAKRWPSSSISRAATCSDTPRTSRRSSTPRPAPCG